MLPAIAPEPLVGRTHDSGGGCPSRLLPGIARCTALAGGVRGRWHRMQDHVVTVAGIGAVSLRHSHPAEADRGHAQVLSESAFVHPASCRQAWFAAAYWSSVTGSSQVVPSP